MLDFEQKQFFFKFILKIWWDSIIKSIEHLWEFISSAFFGFYLTLLSQVVKKIGQFCDLGGRT